jgi:hypothetical protein
VAKVLERHLGEVKENRRDFLKDTCPMCERLCQIKMSVCRIAAGPAAPKNKIRLMGDYFYQTTP